MKQIRHDDKVAIGCQLIRDQLGVDETVADHIGQQQNGPLGRAICRTSKVCFD